MRRVLFAILAGLAVFAPSLALADEVPKVYLYVNDLASPHALLSNEAHDIEDICYQVDLDTTAEIAILVVNTTGSLGIDMFAVRTFEVNGIGKKGQDNGVLIVVSTDEHAWRVEVGYGLEGVLTDGFVARVGREEMAPYISAGDFYTGIYNGTVAIGQKILDEYEPGPGSHPRPDLIVIDWRTVAIGVAIFLVISVITKGRLSLWVVGSIFKRGGFGGGRSGGGGASGKF